MVKDVRRLGRWILRLAEFKFKVKHKCGVDNVLADALSPMFNGESAEDDCVGSQRSAHTVYVVLMCFVRIREKQRLFPYTALTDRFLNQRFNSLQPSGHYMYRQINIQQFYVLPTHFIFVFCVDPRKTAIISLYSNN